MYVCFYVCIYLVDMYAILTYIHIHTSVDICTFEFRYMPPVHTYLFTGIKACMDIHAYIHLHTHAYILI